MFLKKRHKSKEEASSPSQEHELCIPKGGIEPHHIDLKLQLHHGIPRTSSKLSYDPIQRLLAVATLDGKIKLIGKDHVEGMLISGLQSRCKFLEFANNQGFIVNITVENYIQIWDLEKQLLSQSHKWHTNVSAFANIQGTPFMYIGEDSGDVSVIQYSKEENKLCQMPYSIPLNAILGFHKSPPSVIGILPFPETNHTRVLLAYSDGVIVVWGIYDARAIIVKNIVRVSGNNIEEDTQKSISEDDEEKDICCLCWTDTSGHLLAVGYTDGDIWIWDLEIASSVPFLKLQSSSDNSRSPVLSLRWCNTVEKVGATGLGGYLFVYGGQEFECSEDLMVFDLSRSTGNELNHLNLSLEGVFEDMILLPKAGSTMSDPVAVVLILTSQGQLYAYDGISIRKRFSDMTEGSAPENPDPHPVNPFVTKPSVTAVKITDLSEAGELAEIFKEFPHYSKDGIPSVLSGGTAWPVTGGHIQKHLIEGSKPKTIVITGHADGSVNFWDASNSTISQLCNMSESLKVHAISNPDSVEVSHIEFCTLSGVLVVSWRNGGIVIYKLNSESCEVKCVFIKDSQVEEKQLTQNAGFQQVAVLDLYGAPVCSVVIDGSSEYVAVSYANGMVCLFDVPMRTVVFNDAMFLDEKKQISNLTFSPQSELLMPATNDSANVTLSKQVRHGVLYGLAEDLSIIALVYDNGSSTISGPWKTDIVSKPVYICSLEIRKQADASAPISNEEKINIEAWEPNMCLCYIFVCTQISIHMYVGTKDNQVVNIKSVRVINLPSSCCYVSKFMSKTANASGLVLLDINGTLQIRSLPDLDTIKQLSLVDIYNLDPKRSDRPLIACGENGLMTVLDSRRELLLFSIAVKDDESSAAGNIVNFFDRELAAAADAALKAEIHQSRRKTQIQDFIGGMIKDLRGGSVLKDLRGSGVLKDIKGKMLKVSKMGKDQNVETAVSSNLFEIFSSSVIEQASSGGSSSGHQVHDNATQEDDELDIDDIIIDDEDESISEKTSEMSDPRNKGKEKLTEDLDDRAKLFSDDTHGKPVRRSPEEIKAKYGRRTAGDVHNAAGMARDKLLERGERLQALNNRTEEMQRGAENFAALATELAKAVEGRKWWQI